MLIQGGFGGHEGWFFQVRAFKKRFQVITFDNRGIGKSDIPGESYTIKTMAQDTIGLLDYLDINQTHLLGLRPSKHHHPTPVQMRPYHLD